mmetsp:Transcript_18416/g.51192  ORF Transcript_18416/g.51192 Transcript_18416/m.51192 type:complete len:258 (-) Transcript_18416:436-1209(-)
MCRTTSCRLGSAGFCRARASSERRSCCCNFTIAASLFCECSSNLYRSCRSCSNSRFRSCSCRSLASFAPFNMSHFSLRPFNCDVIDPFSSSKLLICFRCHLAQLEAQSWIKRKARLGTSALPCSAAVRSKRQRRMASAWSPACKRPSASARMLLSWETPPAGITRLFGFKCRSLPGPLAAPALEVGSAAGSGCGCDCRGWCKPSPENGPNAPEDPPPPGLALASPATPAASWPSVPCAEKPLNKPGPPAASRPAAPG